jgi:hypothetical protein
LEIAAAAAAVTRAEPGPAAERERRELARGGMAVDGSEGGEENGQTGTG